jgi:hypothetical protein
MEGEGESDSYSALVYTVRIPGFHPGGPGSIPGCGIFLFSLLFLWIFYLFFLFIGEYSNHSLI